MAQPSKLLAYHAARLRALGKRRGGTWLQAKIWNWEFRSGQWDYLRDTADDSIYPLLISTLKNGRLLDLGCGAGTIRCELPPESMSRYVGVDISTDAIAQAEQRCARLAALPEGQLFIAGSIADPAVLSRVGNDFDVILLRETLYFVHLDAMPAFVASLTALLSSRGLVVIRIWDRYRYAAHVDAVRQLLNVVAEEVPADKPSISLVAAVPGER